MRKIDIALIILAIGMMATLPLVYRMNDTTNHDLLTCMGQVDGTDSDCEWCDMITEDKERKLIEQNSSYSVVFVEKVDGRLDTFALDYLTETEYKLFIKHSKPMKP